MDNIALDAIRSNRPGSPVVARALAMVHTTQFEPWGQYDDPANGTLLGSKLGRLLEERTAYNKTRATSFAAYRVLSDLFPNMQSYFDSVMAVHELDPSNKNTNPATPVGKGNLAAARSGNMS